MVTKIHSMDFMDLFLWVKNLTTMHVPIFRSRGAGNVAACHVGAQQGARDAGHQAHRVGGEVDVVRQELSPAQHAPLRDLVNTPGKLRLVDCLTDVADPGHHWLVHFHLLWDKFSSLGAKSWEETDCK